MQALFEGFSARLGRRSMVASVAVVTSITFAYAWIYYPISQGHTGDFLFMLSHREVGSSWWDGRGVGYGPVFALYDLVLRPHSDLVALRLMFAANLGMLIVAFVVTVRTFLAPSCRYHELLAACFLFVSFYPTVQALRQDNVEITELLFLVLMLAALRRDNEWIAGVCLGIAGATKILPFALVPYFLWRRRSRTALVAVATGVALLFLVIALKGETIGIALDDWRSHAAGVPFPYEFQGNQALSGFWYRLFSTIDLSNRWNIEHPVLRNADAARLGTLASSVAAFVVIGGLVVRRAGLKPQPARDARVEGVEVALVLTSMLVLIPHSHAHYFVMISWVFVAALRDWPRPEGVRGRWATGALAASYLALGMLLYARLLDPVLSPLGPVTGIDLARLASLPLFGALAAVVGLLLVHDELVRATHCSAASGRGQRSDAARG